MNGLLTDLYQLTMAAGYFAAGKSSDIATFELTTRRLPRNRNFLIAAGLEQAVNYLSGLRFTRDEIDYLRGLPQFSRADAAFFDYLAGLRFTGDLWAVPEGAVAFPGEPLVTVRAPIIEAQIAETYLLAAIGFETLIASKAARVREAAGDRVVVEFGTRRAHTAEAGLFGARAAFIGGCDGTSNVLAGYRYGIPVYGTAAHSWVMSFETEEEAFRRLHDLLGPGTIYIVDTYDTLEGARRAAALGKPLWGVRLDSGDLARLSRETRRILDQAGLREARIMASGDLDETRIRDLLAQRAPIDAFGVGTELATSADDPRLSAIYKLVEIESRGVRRFTLKTSEEKATLPGAKQIFRYPDRDLVGCAWEPLPRAGGMPLLERIMEAGRLVAPLPDVRTARCRAEASLAALPPSLRRLDAADPFPVEHTEELRSLAQRARRRIQEETP